MELHRDWDSVEHAACGRLDRSAQSCLFDRLAWFRLLARHNPPAGELLALQAKGREQDSWLFLAVADGTARGYANWYSLRFAAVGDEPETLEAVATALRRHRPAIHTLLLEPLDSSNPLPRAFASAGWLTLVDPATTSWTIDTRGMDFDAYWATRGSRLRNTAKRKAKAAGLDIEVRDRFDPEAWAAYEHVYERSWKPAEGSPAFLRALAEQEAAAGALRLGIARKEGEPVAAQLWLVENGTATIHKLAYVEAARELSPGTVLSVAMFRRVLDADRVDRIDFGTGDDAYKADWMDRSSPLNRLQAFNPSTFQGLAGALRAKASKLVRRVRSH
ncbi:MAG: GNAT family N-acetyltransferase [Sphingomonadales bacterium]